MPRLLLPALQVAAVSGYEVPIVVMAVVALVVIVASSIVGVLTRLSRGRVAARHQRGADRSAEPPLP